MNLKEIKEKNHILSLIYYSTIPIWIFFFLKFNAAFLLKSEDLPKLLGITLSFVTASILALAPTAFIIYFLLRLYQGRFYYDENKDLAIFIGAFLFFFLAYFFIHLVTIKVHMVHHIPYEFGFKALVLLLIFFSLFRMLFMFFFTTKSREYKPTNVYIPTPVLTAGGPTTFCAGDSVILSVPTVPNLPNAQYAWKWNGNILVTNYNSFYVATQPGVYTVEYVNGLVYSNTSNAITIIVNPLPIVPAITSNAPLCVGGSLNLGNNVPLGVTYAWTGPNGFASTLSNPIITTTTMADSGKYYLTITNTTTGCKNSNNSNIIVSSYPNASILNTTLSYCEGSSLVLNANTGSNLTYQWYNGNNAIFNAVNTNYTVTQPGTFKVVVKNQYNCSTTSTPKTVIQIPLPTAVISAVNTNEICEGDTAFMSTPAGVGYAYEWYKSNVYMPGFTTSLAYATTAAFYQVKVTANGCSRTSVLYGVVVHSLTKPIIIQNGNVLSTQSYTTYQWSLNGVPIAGANSQSIMTNQQGNYSVKVSSFGCFDSSNVYTFTTGVNTISKNAIYCSPNPTTGKFTIYGTNVKNVEVYNMFGALVHTIDNSNEIDLSNFAQGIYTLRLFDDKHQLIYTDKVMKQD